MSNIEWSHQHKCWLKHFYRITCLILNAPESHQDPGPDDYPDTHAFNCRRIRKFFVKYFDADIVWLHMDEDSTKQEFLSRIKGVLAGKTSDELVIPFFEGHAYGENAKYFWDLYYDGPDRVKGYDVIGLFHKYGPDVMAWLDCHTHDRISDPAIKAKMKREDYGNTEIITTGTQHKDRSGKTGYDPGKEFTHTLIIRLENWVDGLVEEREADEAAELRGKPRSHPPKHLQTVPGILKRFSPMISNANRPGRRRTKAGGEEVIWRFVIDPEQVKQTGKIEIYAKLLQGDVGQGEPPSAGVAVADEDEDAEEDGDNAIAMGEGEGITPAGAGPGAAQGPQPSIEEEEDEEGEEDEGVADMGTEMGSVAGG